ncbi:MAG: VOC family protein [Lysobacteraceae bacterium]|nr:MAG: VOC family protein [Xanthomonadaceae bacterium]
MNAPDNRHPAVMFEIMARDQAAMRRFYSHVFGWRYREGREGFAYVDFPLATRPLLGGIGQSQTGVPGMAPGHVFYLRVDDLDATIAHASMAGGSVLMSPASVDGYRFAMILDPEGNTIGLVEPFTQIE